MRTLTCDNLYMAEPNTEEREVPVIQAFARGIVPYEEWLSEMNQIREAVSQKKSPEHIVFLQHPPTITMGSDSEAGDFLVSKDFLKSKGIGLYPADRGGRLTYHGPGQLLVYIILDLQKRGLDAKRFVWQVEETARLLFSRYGIETCRRSEYPGLWIEKSKIMALGFRILKGVTSHPCALNISGDLEPFSYIIPCGIKDASVTSLLKETGKKYSLPTIIGDFISLFEYLFQSKIKL